MARSYPRCKFGHVIDPNTWDDSDRYCIIDGEIYCKECVAEWLKDRIKYDLFGLVEEMGIPVVGVSS